jgi:hypothetical protein
LACRRRRKAFGDDNESLLARAGRREDKEERLLGGIRDCTTERESALLSRCVKALQDGVGLFTALDAIYARWKDRRSHGIVGIERNARRARQRTGRWKKRGANRWDRETSSAILASNAA